MVQLKSWRDNILSMLFYYGVLFLILGTAIVMFIRLGHEKLEIKIYRS